MMPVPSYQIIEFLHWLGFHGVRISLENPDEKLLHGLAEHFVQGNRHLYWNRNNSGWEPNTISIDNREDIEQSARRLISTLLRIIKRSELPQKNSIEILDLINIIGYHKSCSQELRQCKEFLEWIYRKYPLIIKGDIPKYKINELAIKFCTELGYNERQFQDTIVKLRTGDVKKGWLIALNKWLNPLKYFNTKDMYKLGEYLVVKELLNRYNLVGFHGMFLFTCNDNLPKFINDYWEDLHYLTGNYMNIYYTYDDLKSKVSGYQYIGRDLRSLDVKLTHIPAFIIWSKSLKNNRTIPLGNLSHKYIFKLIQIIVQGIKEGKSLNEVAYIGLKWAKSDRSHQLKTNALVINGGERIIMVNNGDNYEVSGQAGAVGRNATAYQNTFTQVRQECENISLDADSLNKLQLLANNLMNQSSFDLTQSLTYEAVAKLLAIKEATEKQDRNEQAKAVTNWRHWLNGVGEKAQKYLSVTADAVSLGLPLLKLLGLPVP